MLGVIGAMKQEVEHVKSQMQQVEIKQIAKMDFYVGNLKGNPCVVVQSGIGKVNAAICAQILIDHFQVGAIINTGIAGSLRSEINIGDMVLSTQVVQHDMDVTQFGYKPGQIPGQEGIGHYADKDLLNCAKACCEKVNPEIQTFTGKIVSGDQFVSSKEKKDWILNTFDGYCTEMEGAAIGHAASCNQVPFLIIRAISDKADNSATVDYAEFEAKAIEHSVNLILEIAGVYQG